MLVVVWIAGALLTTNLIQCMYANPYNRWIMRMQTALIIALIAAVLPTIKIASVSGVPNRLMICVKLA